MTTDNSPSCFRCTAPAVVALVKQQPSAPERTFTFAVCREHFMDVAGTMERLDAMVNMNLAAEWN